MYLSNPHDFDLIVYFLLPSTKHLLQVQFKTNTYLLETIYMYVCLIQKML